jgi:hypothetical protein
LLWRRSSDRKDSHAARFAGHQWNKTVNRALSLVGASDPQFSIDPLDKRPEQSSFPHRRAAADAPAL